MPEPKLRISIAGLSVAIAKGDREALDLPASGVPRPIGDTHTARYRFEGVALVERVSSSALSGRVLSTPLEQITPYTPSADLRTLNVETTYQGGELWGPVVFRATYDRI